MRRLLPVAIFLFLILVLVLLLRARGILPGRLFSRETPLPLDLAAVKPGTWAELTAPGNINIDGDADPEWLLLYEDASALRGGAIFDRQSEPLGNQSAAIPNEASAFLTLYRLLPGSTAQSPAGYLGDGELSRHLLRGDSEGLTVKEGENLLLIMGARPHSETAFNRATLFWWIGREQGYGGTQATTPGWFSVSDKDPQEQAWNNLTDDAQLWAWEPQVDRAGICRRSFWELKKGSKATAAYRFVAHYSESTLAFCNGAAPAEPIYPEGQVLAFALDRREQRVAAGAILAELPSPDVSQLALRESDQMALCGQGEAQGRLAVRVATGGERFFEWAASQQAPSTITDPIRWRINCLAEIQPGG